MRDLEPRTLRSAAGTPFPVASRSLGLLKRRLPKKAKSTEKRKNGNSKPHVKTRGDRRSIHVIEQRVWRPIDIRAQRWPDSVGASKSVRVLKLDAGRARATGYMHKKLSDLKRHHFKVVGHGGGDARIVSRGRWAVCMVGLSPRPQRSRVRPNPDMPPGRRMIMLVNVLSMGFRDAS